MSMKYPKKVRELEDLRRKLESELDILNADYISLKKSSSDKEKQFAVTNDMKDSMLEALRADIVVLQDQLHKEAVQLLDRMRELEEAQSRAATSDDKLARIEKDNLLKTQALDNARNTFHQSGVQFSEKLGLTPNSTSRTLNSKPQPVHDNTPTRTQLSAVARVILLAPSCSRTVKRTLARHHCTLPVAIAPHRHLRRSRQPRAPARAAAARQRLWELMHLLPPPAQFQTLPAAAPPPPSRTSPQACASPADETRRRCCWQQQQAAR